jgi:undecaprenyl diphosphate synthase
MTTNKLHVAVIMDGNGRWAAGQGLPRIAGHYAGAEALRSVIESAPECGIGTLTAYGFSSDNWKRPGEEVCALMELIAGYLESETERFTAAGVRLSVIGRRDRLPERLLAAIAYSEGKTSGGQGLHFQLAIDYSARETMLRAARDARFEEMLEQSQPVDLLIRTGGEQRLSDFLLWECAYAELLFTRRMWPEFDGVELRRALSEFRQRERRFGGLPAPLEPQFRSDERWLR